MLDKSIEFYSIIMRHPNNVAPMLPDVPQGFSVRYYEKGDEQDWAKIGGDSNEGQNARRQISTIF